MEIYFYAAAAAANLLPKTHVAAAAAAAVAAALKIRSGMQFITNNFKHNFFCFWGKKPPDRVTLVHYTLYPYVHTNKSIQ